MCFTPQDKEACGLPEVIGFIAPLVLVTDNGCYSPTTSRRPFMGTMATQMDWHHLAFLAWMCPPRAEVLKLGTQRVLDYTSQNSLAVQVKDSGNCSPGTSRSPDLGVTVPKQREE